jgi:hypothetical protein
MSIRSVALAVSVVGMCVAAAGCFRAQARATPDLPPLEVPAPPPRLVDPVVTAIPPPVSIGEPPLNAPSPRPLPPPQQRTDANKAEPPKTDPVSEPPPPSEAPRAPQTTLQTTPAEQEADVERKVRALLARSAADLIRVDYRSLNADARTQYETARRFSSQAEAALRDKNLVFASFLADKAATLAAELAGR